MKKIGSLFKLMKKACEEMSISLTELRPYPYAELHELALKNARELAGPIIKRWYDYILGQAKIGRTEAMIELWSIFDELTLPNQYVLTELERLFPGCQFIFHYKAHSKGEYQHVYKMTW